MRANIRRLGSEDGAGVIVLTVGFVITVALNSRSAYQIARRLLLEEAPDAIVLDVGRALLEGLKGAELVSPNLSSDFVCAVHMPNNSIEVFLSITPHRKTPSSSSTNFF